MNTTLLLVLLAASIVFDVTVLLRLATLQARLAWLNGRAGDMDERLIRIEKATPTPRKARA